MYLWHNAKKKHEKGDTIIVKTKYVKENECIVHNFVGYTGTKRKAYVLLFDYSCGWI